MTNSFNNNNNGNRWVFSEASFEKINGTVNDLCSRLKAHVVVFADMNGYPISFCGDTRRIDINNLTAVGAGTFSATAEMAHLIHEKQQFKYIYHEGESQNIYLCNVGDDYLMIVVFGKKTAVGMVRALTAHAVERLTGFFSELQGEKEKATEFLDDEFRSLLGKELDKSFRL
ncbi:MAG: hypothetical protein GXO75_02295 [Calditrichaeota bacterium]|nr:hypothetical protein [Calditrichota bacterium]